MYKVINNLLLVTCLLVYSSTCLLDVYVYSLSSIIYLSILRVALSKFMPMR